jgi:hypothetical protein
MLLVKSCDVIESPEFHTNANIIHFDHMKENKENAPKKEISNITGKKSGGEK